MATRSETLGGLNCQVISRVPAGKQPQLVVVLCHGFGAPGTDLVGIGDELLDCLPAVADRFEIIFPAAPLSLDHLGMWGGRAWWPIDMDELLGAMERGEFRNLSSRRPTGMTEARDHLLSLVNEVQLKTELPANKFILGGFSQGSMLAVEAALNGTAVPGGLCLWSSTLVCEPEWRANAGKLKGIPVLQSHGKQDQILPFEAAIWLRDLLIEAGAEMNFIEFRGPHTIPMPGLEGLAAMIQRLM